MPLYEYQCKPNQHRFEVRHGFNEEPVHACPECGGEVRRVIHPVGVVFKGSGFYATDSRKPGPTAKPAESKPAAAPAGGSDSKAPDAKPSDSKPASDAASTSTGTPSS